MQPLVGLLPCDPMRAVACTCLFAAAVLGPGCGEPDGSIELAWVFVDRDGDPIFPGGVFSTADEESSCGLPGMVGEESRSYDLRVELEICDPECEAGCAAEQCLISPRRTFACNDARGNEPAVPASDESYQFTVRAILSAPSIDVECREPTCLAIPAPRRRVIEPGRTADLQVYQIAVDVDHGAGESLDLEACGCV